MPRAAPCVTGRAGRAQRHRIGRLPLLFTSRSESVDSTDVTPGRAAQHVAHEGAVVVEIAGDHLQQIVGGARHVVAGQDAGNAEHFAFEAGRDRAVVHRKAHMNERDHAEPERGPRQLCDRGGAHRRLAARASARADRAALDVLGGVDRLRSAFVARLIRSSIRLAGITPARPRFDKCAAL